MPLLAAKSQAIRYFTERDLLGTALAPVETLWDVPEVGRIVRRQRPDGGWRYPGGNPFIRSSSAYDQLETYRQLGVLVCKYGLDHRHPAVSGAAQFLRSFQTEAGDYRGIYGNQYTPNYSAAITELLILAGYAQTEQVRRTMDWLVATRQDDGGWAIPSRTHDLPLRAMLTEGKTLEPDRCRPSSHLITGVALRAFAAHPQLRSFAVATHAGELLKSRFFARDTYPDRADSSYWLVFSFPFWWTNLLSALDSLIRCGFSVGDDDVWRGVTWFTEHQEPNGLWNSGRNRPKHPDIDLWVALAVGRLLMCAGAAGAGVSLRPAPGQRSDGAG